jgi:uncharacterized protein YcaQ
VVHAVRGTLTRAPTTGEGGGHAPGAGDAGAIRRRTAVAVRGSALPVIERERVIRLWLDRQGLLRPRGTRLTRENLLDHLDRCGALQLDSVNTLARAHLLTLWSRYGTFSPKELDRWLYEERVAYEFWGHEASVLPWRALPLSRRFMRDWAVRGTWWGRMEQPAVVKRRVLRRIREEGPLESADFEGDEQRSGGWWGWKTAKMALELLWREGRLAVSARRHFRRVYDLAERVYPPGPIATRRAYEDRWVLDALAANGVAPLRHLVHYFTAPSLRAAARNAAIERLLRAKRIVAVRVPGLSDTAYALPEHLEAPTSPAPRGTHLLSPFDSLLWQRRRAEELMGFRYRVEIYTPATRRHFGYYVLPILHDGRFAGRLDPRLDRASGRLAVAAVHLEPGVPRTASLERGLAKALRDLAAFVGAQAVELPAGWRRLDV